MSFVGVPVREVVVLKVVRDFRRRGTKSQRHVGRGDSLGGNEDVRLHVPMVHGEPFAGTAPAAHHLVGNQQHAVPVAYFAEAGKVFRGRHQHAIGADDRLDDHGRHVALVADHVLKIIGAGDVAAGIGVFDGQS